MTTRFSITLLCALAVFSVGSGIRGVEAARDTRVPQSEAAVYAAAPAAVQRTDSTPVLPTVVVTATIPADTAADRERPSVMLDAAVDQAGTVLASGASRGVRRIGLLMPYYAFGSNERGTE